MKTVSRITRALELGLALLVIAVIILNGISFFIRHGNTLLQANGFQDFVDRMLLYVIALEFAMMVIKRDPRLVVEILIFATARKMVITMQSGLDFLMGSLAIVLLFSVRFILHRKSDDTSEHILS